MDAALTHAKDGVIRVQDMTLGSADLRGLLDAARPEDKDQQRRGQSVVREALFDGVVFNGDVDFSNVEFSGGASFCRARFEGTAQFEKVTFEGTACFAETTWNGEVRFSGASFDELVLNRAVFARRMRFKGRAMKLLATETEFLAGTDISITHPVLEPPPSGAAPAKTSDSDSRQARTPAEIKFDGATFGAPSTLGPPGAEDRSEAHHLIPRVVSLRGARVVDLALSGVDLRTCCFGGAHGLDSLRLEQVLLDEPPTWTRVTRWQFPPKWTTERWPPRWPKPKSRQWPPVRVWWTRRAAIAEEHQWRAKNHFGWTTWSSSCEPAPRPHRIAATYRALRKGREGGKDQPGAADFYYGEMEMRRHSSYTGPQETPEDQPEPEETPEDQPPLSYVIPSLKDWAKYDNTKRPPRGEKLLLWLYWLVSGYGLRASRALIALALTVVVFALLFSVAGNGSFWHALVFSLQSTVSLFGEPQTEEHLNDWGKLLEVGLRLLGPLFFGLALLSLRGRVKR